MKKALILFMLVLLFVPPLWGIRRVRQVLRLAPAEGARTETEE